MNDPEPLYIRYDAEPLKVDATGCRTVAALIEEAQNAQLHYQNIRF